MTNTNVVRATVFQSILNEWRVILLWEEQELKDMQEDGDWIEIGHVDYDTIEHKIIE